MTTVSADAMPDDLVPVREAAAVAGVSLPRLEGWVRYGHLVTWPSRGKGQLVSLAAVRGLMTTPPVRLTEMQPAAWRSVYTAAQLAGVESYEVYGWIEEGRLSSQRGPRGPRVRLGDVQTLASEQRTRLAPAADEKGTAP